MNTFNRATFFDSLAAHTSIVASSGGLSIVTNVPNCPLPDKVELSKSMLKIALHFPNCEPYVIDTPNLRLPAIQGIKPACSFIVAKGNTILLADMVRFVIVE